MYAIIVKDTDDTYDVIAALRTTEEVRTYLDSEWDKGLPVVGMNISDHKATATKGATWNGTSFDGTANEGFFALSQVEKDSYKQYAFLCENKVIHRVSMETDSDKAELYDAAFAGEVFLVKCAFAVNGTKVSYNQATREISPV
jgi:hypothetical protein